jgi:hypothetical protein
MVVVLLWAVQKFIAPSAHFFLGDREHLYRADTGPAVLPRVFFLDTLVMPDIQSSPSEAPWLWPKITVQRAPTWTLTAFGPIALSAWTVLLAAGLWAMLTLRSLGKFRLVLALGIAGQLLLHTVYGNEYFLYALNWLPLLVTVAALATLTRFRWLALVAGAVFVVGAAYHNYAELEFALDTLSASSRSRTAEMPPSVARKAPCVFAPVSRNLPTS